MARFVVGFEYFDGLGDGRAGLDALGGLPHFGLDAPEFFPAPLVGFFEVEDESVEVAGGAPVAVGADGVALGCTGQVGVTEPVGELSVGAGGVARAVVEVVLQRWVLLRAFCGEVVKEAVGGGPDAGLFDQAAHLTLGSAELGVESGGERCAVLVKRLGDGAHAGGDLRPVLVGIAGHEVENAAGVLEGRGDDVEGAEVVVGFVAFALGVEALEHHIAGDAVAVVFGLGAFQVAAGGFAQGGARVAAVGREVGQLRLRPRQPKAGGEVGVQRGEGADVGVGDVGDLCHAGMIADSLPVVAAQPASLAASTRRMM